MWAFQTQGGEARQSGRCRAADGEAGRGHRGTEVAFGKTTAPPQCNRTKAGSSPHQPGKGAGFGDDNAHGAGAAGLPGSESRSAGPNDPANSKKGRIFCAVN